MEFVQKYVMVAMETAVVKNNPQELRIQGNEIWEHTILACFHWRLCPGRFLARACY